MILLVTPEVEFSKQMASLLEAKGYLVTLAFQGSKVSALVSQGNPQLIIVNLYLRNPSGLEILLQLRAEGYAGKIIVLASSSTSTDIPEALVFGVHHVLGQPLSLNRLVSAVRLAIGPSVKHETQVTRQIKSYTPLATMPWVSKVWGLLGETETFFYSILLS